MLLLAVVSVLFLIDSVMGKETIAWAIAVSGIVVLIWRRSAQLAIPRALMQVLVFPFLLLVVSLHGIYTHPLPDFLKDLWYFTLPLVYVSFGYLAFERIGNWQRLMQPLILVGLGIGIYAIANAVLNRGELAAAGSVDAYRAVTGGGSFIPMVPLMLILMARRTHLPEFGLERWKPLRVLVYVAATGAVLITFSRTHMVTLLAGVLCALNFRGAMRRMLRSGGVGMIVALVGLAAGTYYLSQAKSGPVDMFLKKVANSGSEVQVRAYETFEQINNNWRGYEAYRATKTYERYSTTDKIFGGGGGSMVDLGFAMQLSPTEVFKYVPITHNGYMYILIKDGVCGIVLFALFALQLFWMGRRALKTGDPEARFAGLLLLWTPIVMAATQGVITGIYNKGELIPILFLAGAAAASYAQRRRALEEYEYQVAWRGADVGALRLRPGAIAAEGTL